MILILAGAGYMTLGGGLQFAISGPTTVWCDTYEWRACGYKPQGLESARITAFLLQPRQNFICNADRCDVEQLTEGVITQLILNSNQHVSQLPLRMFRGDGLAVDGGAATIQWRPWRLELRSCGTSACSFNDAPLSSGISGTLITANTCTFITDDTIYGAQGQVIREPAGSSVSYTIPAGEAYQVRVTGVQTPCGQTENQCDTNDDCKLGRPYVYNGLGAVVQNGNLLTYTCNTYGQQPSRQQLNLLPGQSPSYFQFGKRCESSVAKTGVCTPGSNSCGSNAVCDVTTFTCKAAEQVACRYDSECGSGEFYDLATKSYYRNACQNAGTAASRCARTLVRQVECAYSAECPQTYYCDAAQGRCLENTMQKTSCPLACCDGDPRYFDKPAPPGNICCPGGLKYAATLAECGDNNGGAGEGPFPVEIIFAALAGLLGFAILRRRDIVLAAVVGIAAGIMTYLIVAFILKNWLLLLIAGVVGGWLFGGAILSAVLVIVALLVRK